MPITITDSSEAAAEIARRVERHNRIVFFGGAGVSTASGIPDFRSVDGLYHQKFAYPPETMLSHDFFETHTAEFYEFYRTKMIALGAKPNQAHLKLAELERAGKLTAVVTQNIDGLHQAAGSKNVLELHGSVHRNICQRCGHVYSAEWIMAREHEDERGVPICPECGGPIKPDVVLYGEGLDNQVVSDAILAIREADMLIVGGTSLVVYPAAGLIDYFLGQELVVVNRDPIPVSSRASVIVQADIAKAFDF
ncbi:NAD-dependent protein deacylase [Parolsenella catena]|uniref:NAD-dependent protein deacylase n=1 Tax=Parolsenella catena TaxID=2003188 RepID=UPI002FD98AEA